MPTYVLIAIVCAAAVGRSPDSTPVDQCLLRFVLTLGAMLVTCMMARILVTACTIDSDLSPSNAETQHQAKRDARRQQKWERWHLVIWAAMSGLLIFVVAWPNMVRSNWGLGGYVLIDDLVILIPFVTPWLVSWALFYELECSTRSADRTTSIPISARIRFAFRQAKFAFGFGLLPVFLVCLVVDIAAIADPALADQPVPPSFFIVPMGIVMLIFPFVLRRLWSAHPLPDGPLRQELLQVADNSQIRMKKILVWNTGGQSLNAAVAGVIPKMRTVFLTDRLIDELPSKQIAAAMAHELGHVQHGHLLLRMMALFFPISLIISASTIASWISTTAESGLVTNDSSPVAAFALLIIAALYLWKVIGGFCRRLEFEADTAGVEILAAHLGNRDMAVDVFKDMLTSVTTEADRESGWLHPSITSRIAAIESRRLPRNVSQMPQLLKRISRFLLYSITCLAVSASILGG